MPSPSFSDFFFKQPNNYSFSLYNYVLSSYNMPDRYITFLYNFSFHFQSVKTDSIQLAAQNRVNLIQNQLYKQFVDRVSYELNYQDRPLPQLANFIRDMRRELLEARQLISVQKQEIVQLTAMLGNQQNPLRNKRVATVPRATSASIKPKKRVSTPQRRQQSSKHTEMEQQIENYQLMSQCQQEQLSSQQELIKQLKKDNKELKYYVDQLLQKEAQKTIEQKEIQEFMNQSQADKSEIEDLKDQISVLQQKLFVYEVQDKIASKVAFDCKVDKQRLPKPSSVEKSSSPEQHDQYTQQYKEKTTIMELQNKVRVYGEQIQHQQEQLQAKGSQINNLENKLQEVYYKVFELGQQKSDLIQDKLNHQSCLKYLNNIASLIDQYGIATDKAATLQKQLQQAQNNVSESIQSNSTLIQTKNDSQNQPNQTQSVVHNQLTDEKQVAPVIAQLKKPDSASDSQTSSLRRPNGAIPRQNQVKGLEESEIELGVKNISAMSSPKSYAELAALIGQLRQMPQDATPKMIQEARQALEAAKKTLDPSQYATLNDQLTTIEHKSAIKEAEEILEEVKSEKDKTPEEPVLLNLAPMIDQELKNAGNETFGKSQTAMSMTQQIDDFIGEREKEEKQRNEINLVDPRSILTGNEANNQYEVMFMAPGDAKTEKLSQLLQFNYDLKDTGMDALQSDINDMVGLGEFSQAVDMMNSVPDRMEASEIHHPQAQEGDQDKPVDIYVDAMCDMTKSLNNTVNQAMRQITGKIDHNIHYE